MDTERFIYLPDERLQERGEELEALLEIPHSEPRKSQLERELAHVVFELTVRLQEQNNGDD